MKKTISILLIVAMMLATVLAIIPASAAPKGEPIKNADDFANMTADGEYYLANDITIKASYKGDFKGKLHGEGNTITVNSATPLFEKIVGGTVEDLNIKMAFEQGIGSGGAFGALAKVASGTFKKINATINFKFAAKTSGTNIGGLIGQVNGKTSLANITVDGAITETVLNKDSGTTAIGMGGIIGNVNGDIDVEIKTTANYANIVVQETCIASAGIVGSQTGESRLTIDRSQNYGNIDFNVDGGQHVGSAGFVGYIAGSSTNKASLEITDSRNYGNLTSTGAKQDHMIGGFAGRVYGLKKLRIDGCVNSGNISGTSVGWASAGGIVGNIETYNFSWSKNTEADLKITNCVNTGSVANSGNNDSGNGGILGSLLQANTPNVKLQILSCSNYGAISGNNAGGIMGKQGVQGGGNKLIIKDCYNAGEAGKAGIVATVYQTWDGAAQDKNVVGITAFGENSYPTKPYEIPEILNCVSDNGKIIDSYGYAEYAAANNPMANSHIEIKNCVGDVPGGSTYVVTDPTDASATRAEILAKVPGNPAPIDALLADYSNAVESDYESGWAEFAALYKQAIAATKVATVQSVFDELIPQVEAALESLVAKSVETELPKLAAAIEAAEGVRDTEGNEDKYTPRTWEAFCTAIAAAKAIADKDGAKLSEIGNAIKDMADAQKALAEKPDKTPMDDAFAKYAALDVATYVSASWTAFQNTIKEANAVKDDINATKADVDAALKLMKDAYNALIKKVSPAALVAKADKALKDYNEDEYTAKSYGDLKATVKKAKNDAEKNDMSAADVNESSAAIDAAIEALVVRGNFDDIDAALEPFGEVLILGDKPAVDTDLVEELEEVYTRGSVKNFSAALNNIVDARKKENLPNLSEYDASRLLKTLQSAIDGLVPYASYTEIDARTAEFAELDKAKYTEDSWAALESAINAAAELKYNRNASKPQSDAALAKIEAAFAALTEVEVEEEAPVADDAKGCKSAIGATIVVMTATLALGATTLLKKKED